jgi:hypothetical protein
MNILLYGDMSRYTQAYEVNDHWHAYKFYFSVIFFDEAFQHGEDAKI